MPHLDPSTWNHAPISLSADTPSSCGAASYIAAFKAGIIGSKLKTEEVSIRTHKTADGADYYAVNPKGNVPALVLVDGTLLNEGAAVLQW